MSSQCYVSRLKENGNPLEASDWEEPIRVQKADGSPLLNEADGITLDMTWFEVDGVPYVCWSQRLFANGENPGLVIAKADPDEPWKLAGQPVRIAENRFSWERDGCNAGPYVIVNEDTVYMVFSANGVVTAVCNGDYDSSGWP